jgi:hypothetical protein
MSDKDEFVERWRHELAGPLLDAVMGGRKGAELSMWLAMTQRKIEGMLSKIFDEAGEPESAEAIADRLVIMCPKLEATVKKSVVEKLRVAFTEKKS